MVWYAMLWLMIIWYLYYFKLIIYRMDQGLISTKLRSVITLVDKLRDIKLESYIKLPKIVAVGSQSSGKSSLVQQIVGLDFLPRGSGVVTRRPLEIRMVYQKDLKQPYAKFAELPQTITNFAKVKQSIEKLTEKVCGNRKNIIDLPIILDIYSSNCPNLTIIDLPGLTRIPIDGQASNIFEVTTNMIKKYMQQPSTIILCVIPANQDITNDQVLHIARKIDTTGQRTIGCITKIDIMDRGSDARNLLSNKQVVLKLGYVGIKNRSQADINEKKTVQQSIQEEKMYFTKSPIYSSLPLECLGTTSLVNKLTKVLTENICKFLPQLIQKIKTRKGQLHDIVKSYGRPLPKTNGEKQSLIWQLCSKFIQQYKKCLIGQISVLKCRDKLLKISSNIQNSLTECLQEQFNYNINQLLPSNKIEFALRKFEGSNMPGFPSISAFLFLLHPLLHQMKVPLELTIDSVFDHLINIIQVICVEIAVQYPQFRAYLFQKISNILNKYRKSCKQYLDEVMQSQLNYIYTNSSQYEDILEQIEQKQDKKNIQKNPMVTILRKRINAYYRIVIKNIRDLMPKNIKYNLVVTATKTIEFEIFQIINQTNKFDEFLKIGQSSRQERIRNQQQFAILCKAQEFILTHSGLASFRNVDQKRRIMVRQREIQEAERRKQQKDGLKNQVKKQVPNNQDRNRVDNSQSPVKNTKNIQVNPNKDAKKIQPSPANQSLFNAFFGKKPEQPKQQPQQKPNQANQGKVQSNPVKAPIVNPNPPSIPNEPPKKSKFDDIFGFGSKKTQQPIPPSPIQPKKEEKPKVNLTDTYNKEVGKATDKAVDNLYANQQFKQKSKQAVADGTSVAAQKKLGVSEQTGKTIGKGAAWLFGQDVTQNYMKQQTKKNIKQQTQIPPK